MEFLLYLDPGSGSIILQVVLSSVFAMMFFFKNSLRSFGHFVSSMFRRKDEDSAQPKP